MKKYLILFCLIPASAFAWSLRKVKGLNMPADDRVSINVNFKNIDYELGRTVHKNGTETITGDKIFTGKVRLPSKTLAQLLADSPTAVGEIYYCSNCTTDTICVSTGTSAGAVARATARTTACS